MTVPSNLAAIRDKVRRITGRPSDQQISNPQIDAYINTFYLYDLPEHLQLISNRVNFQFLTTANKAIYDLPNDFYLTAMPPVRIAGYQSYMTQSREAFYRINPSLSLMQGRVGAGNGTRGPYTFQFGQTPFLRGWKRNPPGAYSVSVAGTQSNVPASQLSWQVLISGTDANGNSISLVDDGQGNLFDPGNLSTNPPNLGDLSTVPANSRGTVNYLTGVVTVNDPAVVPLGPGFSTAIATNAPINAQYVPYVPSRPQSVVFFQQQFNIFPIPDQAYTVSLEAYALPTALLDSGGAGTDIPQMREWWQALAYGAADKIFTDNADLDSAAKFRPLLDEQLKLIQRRTIVQQSSDRTATIYSEQNSMGQYPFGNLFGNT